MQSSVTITTGARLHFGLIVAGEPDRRSYGGVGLMVDQPRCSLTVRRADQDRILAPPDTAARVAEFLARVRNADSDDCWAIEVREDIPAHAGLGSGTQLGLAVAAAVSRLRGETDISVAELARRAGRSARSIIGTVGFESGGLIAHGLEPTDDEPRRCDFPENWRFVLVTPGDHQGLSGELERAAFRQMPPMKSDLRHRLREIQRELWNAVADHDFETSSRDLYQYGQLVGEYFAPVQGGVFASSRMAALAETLRSDGISGVGQTSWGPTVFALCASQERAASVAETVRRSTAWGDCDVRIAVPRNQGADVESGSG